MNIWRETVCHNAYTKFECQNISTCTLIWWEWFLNIIINELATRLLRVCIFNLQLVYTFVKPTHLMAIRVVLKGTQCEGGGCEPARESRLWNIILPQSWFPIGYTGQEKYIKISWCAAGTGSLLTFYAPPFYHSWWRCKSSEHGFHLRVDVGTLQLCEHQVTYTHTSARGHYRSLLLQKYVSLCALLKHFSQSCLPGLLPWLLLLLPA